MYGKQVDGTIRSTVVIGPKGDVIKHWPAVKRAETHPEEIEPLMGFESFDFGFRFCVQIIDNRRDPR